MTGQNVLDDNCFSIRRPNNNGKTGEPDLEPFKSPRQFDARAIYAGGEGKRLSGHTAIIDYNFPYIELPRRILAPFYRSLWPIQSIRSGVHYAVE
ncbi:hypothetical protein BJX61DRAFT_527780 [Aspergillus egyptiacus]|nr:hypothetical protein BJX61DRAFT_527780 [Aspergillus egyptiacus]